MAKKKPFYKSKTLWANVLIVAGGVATSLAGQLEAGGSITVLGVLNTALRIMTKEGISLK